MVVVVRPGYRIDSRTIKRGSRVSTFTVSFGESSNLCIIGIIFLGSYPWEDLELVLFSMTSSSSSKTDCICLLYCVFDIGGFTGLSFIDRSNLSSFESILPNWTMMFQCILLKGSSLQFQRAQEHRKRSPDSKYMIVLVMLFLPVFKGADNPARIWNIRPIIRPTYWLHATLIISGP